MAVTYEPIATYTIPSAQSSYTFSVVPGTYTDLVLVFAGTLSASGGWAIRVNGDTAGNYSNTTMYGDGTTAASNRSASDTSMGLGYTTTSQSVTTINLMNYANTTTFKTALARNSAASADVDARVGMWRNTAAITSVTALTYSGNFASGSTFTLYGIKAA